ncbi:hypothetical protein MUK42_00293 [Musa troglodytarum]|uniref:F-box domain-containing protein n=1 Tax=Musa troglodytarum TaxID=320322 RepID=A0A9E7FDN4_9LILI|nr:hypothetical protein MUK42_00293 [Musa troglodytarum]
MGGTLNNTRRIDLVGPKKLGRSDRPLPDDLLAEILSYLPAKTFFRLLSVCKTFRQLSYDSHFLLSQSCHNNVTSGFFLQRRNISVPFFIIDPYVGVPRKSLEILCHNNIIILGSAGGLVFVLYRKDGFLCVYNPARGTRCRLPSQLGKYCPWSGIADKEHDFGGKELDLKHPVVCDNIVFWASSHPESFERINQYVIAFDVKKERTQIIPLPEEVVVAYFDTI